MLYGRDKTLADLFPRGRYVVCRDGVLEDAGFFGLAYGELYEVTESARTVKGERFVCVRDRHGREVRARSYRFHSLRGTWKWGDDGTPVNATEEYREKFGEYVDKKMEAEERFLGGMVRRGCLYPKLFHDFIDLGQKVTRIFEYRADTNLTFISPCRTGMTSTEKAAVCEALAGDLRSLSFGFIRLEGRWGKPTPEEGEVDVDYPYAIMNIGLGTRTFAEIAMALAVKYGQDSVYIWSPEAKRAYTFKTGFDVVNDEDEDTREDALDAVGQVLRMEHQLLEKSIAQAVGAAGGRPDGYAFEFTKEIQHEASSPDFDVRMESIECEGAKERCLLHSRRAGFVYDVRSSRALDSEGAEYAGPFKIIEEFEAWLDSDDVDELGS